MRKISYSYEELNIIQRFIYGNKGRVLYGIQVWTIIQDTWDSILIDYEVIFDTKKCYLI